MNFAVVEIAGKQYLVQEKEIVETQKIPGEKDEKVTFPRVLLYWDGNKLAVGRPYLEGFSVEGIIREKKRGPKLIVYKYKRRKNSSKKIGHRQDLCEVEIEKINTGRSKAAATKTEKSKSPETKTPAATSPASKKAAPKKPSPKKKPAATARKTAGSKKKSPAAKKKSPPAKKKSPPAKKKSRKRKNRPPPAKNPPAGKRPEPERKRKKNNCLYKPNPKVRGVRQCLRKQDREVPETVVTVAGDDWD